ncbi:MAG: esterase family protein [Clostridia bacterium]|nr:esterase family protein [Clostridia bacterium]
MAFLQMEINSAALKETTCVRLLLPEVKAGEKVKTLWLLHGLSDDGSAWMRYSAVERYAQEYGLAVVMPAAGRSWYTDTAYGKKYFTFISEELPAKLSRIFCSYSPLREDNLVAGLSMGGYGACKLALSRPEKYSFCISLSGSLDVTRKGRAYDLDEWRSIFGFGIQSAEDLAGGEHDLFALAARGKDLPYFYLWCGTEDSLVFVNRDFDAHLSALGTEHVLVTSEGDHSWKWWDMHLQNALAFGRDKNLL